MPAEISASTGHRNPASVRRSHAAEPCIHWWICEPPEAGTGGHVGAACSRCGDTRTFDVRAGEVSGETWGRTYANNAGRERRLAEQVTR